MRNRVIAKLRRGNRHHAISRRRPQKTAALQTLAEQARTLTEANVYRERQALTHAR